MPTGIYDRKVAKKRPLCSEETKAKISEATKGRPRTKAQKEAGLISAKCRKGIELSSKIRRKISKALTGKLHSEETKLKQSKKAKQRYASIEERIKARERLKGNKGSNWQGGLTAINKLLRNSMFFRLWREKIFKRDNWTCQECSQRGGELHPHHIKPFANYPKLRFEIDNGITLCRDCHGMQHNHNFGGI